MSRVRGCQWPFSAEQTGSVSLEVTITVASYVCFGLMVQTPYLAIPLALYSVPVVTVILCWAYCVSVDPALPGGIPCKRMAKTQSQTRYCAQCRKVIPGLDHHCSWLNTCVGKRNYVAFFTLAIAGTIQHALGLILGICTAASPAWRGENNSIVGPVVFGAIVAFLGLVGTIAFGSLASFHLYLVYKGYGTVDYIVQRALDWEEKQKKAAAAALAASSASTRQVSGSGAATTAVTTTTTRTEAAAISAAQAASSPGHVAVSVAPQPPHPALFPPRSHTIEQQLELPPLRQPQQQPSPQDVQAVAAVTRHSLALQASGIKPAEVSPSHDEVSREEIEAIAAEVEAGRKLIEANKSRFMATSPGDNVSLFMAARLPSTHGGGPDPAEYGLPPVTTAEATATTTAVTASEGKVEQDSKRGDETEKPDSKKWLGLIAEAENGSVASSSPATVLPTDDAGEQIRPVSSANGVVSSPAVAVLVPAGTSTIAPQPESAQTSGESEGDDLEERVSPMALLASSSSYSSSSSAGPHAASASADASSSSSSTVLTPPEISRASSAISAATAPAAVTDPIPGTTTAAVSVESEEVVARPASSSSSSSSSTSLESVLGEGIGANKTKEAKEMI
jgi:DHHC palmitoyltransferase